MPVRDAIIPEPMVTIKKECCKCHPVISKLRKYLSKTYDDLEDEKSGHK